MSTVKSVANDAAKHAVLSTFAARPFLIEAMLDRIGATGIHEHRGGYRSTCPIHGGDNRNNFAIWFDHTDVPVWKCFSQCNTKGPLHTILVRKYRCTDQEALSWMAMLAGIPMQGNRVWVSPEMIAEETLTQWRRRMGMSKVDAPPVFSDAMLHDSLQWKSDYFVNRHFSREILDYFEVGFVPGGRWLWPDEQQPGKYYGWFEDRVSIPLRLMDGRLTGFSGRRLDEIAQMKYKILRGSGRTFTLYGLDKPYTQQAITQTREVVLVEGFPDVWRAWMHGIYNVVGVIGTDLSSQQVDLLKQFFLDRIVFFYDGDKSGQLSVKRMGKQVRGLCQLRNAVPPEGFDPGDLVDRQAYIGALEQSRVLTLT